MPTEHPSITEARDLLNVVTEEHRDSRERMAHLNQQIEAAEKQFPPDKAEIERLEGHRAIASEYEKRSGAGKKEALQSLQSLIEDYGDEAGP